MHNLIPGRWIKLGKEVQGDNVMQIVDRALDKHREACQTEVLPGAPSGVLIGKARKSGSFLVLEEFKKKCRQGAG